MDNYKYISTDNDEVKLLQNMLKLLNYFPKEVNSIFDSDTNGNKLKYIS